MRPSAAGGGFTRHLNIGSLVIVIGILVAVPLPALIAQPASPRLVAAFAGPAVVSLALGALLFRRYRFEDDDVSHVEVNWQTGSLTVLLAWSYGFVAGAAPFVLAGLLDPVPALFESVSSWTSTGLSVLDVTQIPPVFLLHRAFMQFSGGLGFVLVVLTFVHSKQAITLYSAEGHSDRLAPRIDRTARVILAIYCGFLALGTAAFRLLGMSWFHGLLYAMSALSTGGFGTLPGSTGAHDSLGVEVVTAGLMVVATTNFAVLLLVTRGRWRQVLRVSEVRFAVAVVAVAVPVVVWSLWAQGGSDGVGALRAGTFSVLTTLSTTGYTTVDFATLPQVTLGVLLLLMLVGGGMGSTAGGMKLTRAYVLVRVAEHGLRRRLAPARLVSAPRWTRAHGTASLDAETIAETTGFVLLYLTVFAVGSLALTVTSGGTLFEGTFEFASALSTTGISVGLTGPETGTAGLVVLIAGMVLGRLEIFIVLVGIYAGWRLARRRASTGHSMRADAPGDSP